jgi:predicted amidophosphoribosyltransferase
MMRCPGCRADNREGRRFCAQCGGALAHCHARLGKVYRRIGKPNQEREHVATATASIDDLLEDGGILVRLALRENLQSELGIQPEGVSR